ncbi:hypothetical protein N482_13105 [Pseudoalteromonas luteoviolacea NCIMB 1942]|uniref:Uncharacterized protein n=2 Tax=Pseudoalteromonas luteoviolacea TaxID=43657 RepID=A0A167B062_9GAMM|nr:hypothetical protein N482_13105 [Pseudoalteromonas luteoviolacea NCIMB 1942]
MEEMSKEDINALAGYGVSTAADFIESMCDAPVTIDNETREVIAEKAAPVVAKYCKGGQMPAWFARFQEEIELGIVLASVGFSMYKQIKLHERTESKAEPNKAKSSDGYVKVAANGN